MSDLEVENEILTNQDTSPPGYSSGAAATRYAPWTNISTLPDPTRFLQLLGWTQQQVQLTAQSLPLDTDDANTFVKACEVLDGKSIPLADRRTVVEGKTHSPWEMVPVARSPSTRARPCRPTLKGGHLGYRAGLSGKAQVPSTANATPVKGIPVQVAQPSSATADKPREGASSRSHPVRQTTTPLRLLQCKRARLLSLCSLALFSARTTSLAV